MDSVRNTTKSSEQLNDSVVSLSSADTSMSRRANASAAKYKKVRNKRI